MLTGRDGRRRDGGRTLWNRRRGGSGAAALLGCLLLMAVISAGLLVDVIVGIEATATRVTSAADAAAHAAETTLIGSPAAALLSGELQLGAECAEPAGDSARAIRDPDAAALCRGAVDAARHATGAMGGRLITLRVVPDPRDRGPDPGPGRLEVLVEASLRRSLPIPAPVCGTLCWAEAWSASEQV